MTQNYEHSDLLEFTTGIFLKIGCSQQHATQAAQVLVSADLRGIESHGISRLVGYTRLWDSDRINADPKIKVVHETPSTAVLDGDRGLGLVVAPKAMEIAMSKAIEVGTGWVSVKNSNHFGIAGYHSMLALENNMIGIAMTNASPLVSPTFSLDRLLGTNPISVAIPSGKETPFVSDFATTTAANGKLEVLQRANKSAPTGWLQDADGAPTTDANILKKGGSMLPLGGDTDHGGHKGYMLGSIVDIFSAVLSGANYGPWVPPFVSFLPVPEDPVGEGIGHFLGAMRIDAFRPEADFKREMDKWIRTFRNAKTLPGQSEVLIPGDPERRSVEERMRNGIPINAKVIEDLKTLGSRFEVSFPEARQKLR